MLATVTPLVPFPRWRRCRGAHVLYQTWGFFGWKPKILLAGLGNGVTLMSSPRWRRCLGVSLLCWLSTSFMTGMVTILLGEGSVRPRLPGVALRLCFVMALLGWSRSFCIMCTIELGDDDILHVVVRSVVVRWCVMPVLRFYCGEVEAACCLTSLATMTTQWAPPEERRGCVGCGLNALKRCCGS